jgi:hypothetical protein
LTIFLTEKSSSAMCRRSNDAAPQRTASAF